MSRLPGPHLENAIGASGKTGKLIQQVLYFEAAEVNAMLRHNAANARVWLERALKLRKPESGACVESAVAIGEGRYEDALTKIDAARAWLVKRKQDSGTARFASTSASMSVPSGCAENISSPRLRETK